MRAAKALLFSETKGITSLVMCYPPMGPLCQRERWKGMLSLFA